MSITVIYTMREDKKADTMAISRKTIADDETEKEGLVGQTIAAAVAVAIKEIQKECQKEGE